MITYKDKRVVKDNFQLVRETDHRFSLYLVTDRFNSMLLAEFDDEAQEIRIHTRTDVTYTPPAQDTNLVDRYIHKFTISPFESKVEK